MYTSIRINRAHYPVTVLGPGKRIGIWLQGCSLGCPGCLSRDTWPADTVTLVQVGGLVEWCRKHEPSGVDGITISGGEPFEQPEALETLLRELHAWTDRLNTPVDYLCYSGKSFELLRKQHPQILSMLDTIIPEPFEEAVPGKPLRGSGNQPIIHLTELGASRFAEYGDESRAQAEKRFQFVVDGNSVWFIGIPERGEMERLREQCKSRGLHLKDVSW